MAVVLIVDDDPVSRVVLRHLIAKQGHDVIEAEDGGEATRVLAANAVDLIISDQEMPGMSGLELRKHLGADLAIPFVMLTGYANEDEMRGQAAGIDAFITKPVSSSVIAELLSRWFVPGA